MHRKSCPKSHLHVDPWSHKRISHFYLNAWESTYGNGTFCPVHVPPFPKSGIKFMERRSASWHLACHTYSMSYTFWQQLERFHSPFIAQKHSFHQSAYRYQPRYPYFSQPNPTSGTIFCNHLSTAQKRTPNWELPWAKIVHGSTSLS